MLLSRERASVRARMRAFRENTRLFRMQGPCKRPCSGEGRDVGLNGAKPWFFILFASVVTPVGLAFSADFSARIRFEPTPPALVQMQGDATLHRWEVEGKEVEGALESDMSAADIQTWLVAVASERKPGAVIAIHDTNAVVRVRLCIPARSLQGHNRRMRKDLLEAIQARDYPRIVYEFDQLDEPPVLVALEPEPVIELVVQGRLTLAGETNTIHHTVRIRFYSTDHVQLTGRMSLDMADFNIDPPRALFGLIRVHPAFETRYSFPARMQPVSDEGEQ